MSFAAAAHGGGAATNWNLCFRTKQENGWKRKEPGRNMKLETDTEETVPDSRKRTPRIVREEKCEQKMRIRIGRMIEEGDQTQHKDWRPIK